MKFKIGDAGLLFVATIVVNAGNYLINLMLGRVLGPERFAEASVIATGVLMLSFLAVGLQLSTAKFVAGYHIDNRKEQIGVFYYWITKYTWIISICLAIVLVTTSTFIQSYLHFESFVPFVIIGIGLPFYFGLSIKRGVTQGTDAFKSLALTYLIEMLLRLVFTFGLLFCFLHYYNNYSTEAVSLGFLVSFFAAAWLRIPKIKLSEKIKFDDRKLVLNFMLIILFYEFSQILINNSDVILTKHFFSDQESGLYAAIALIGRVVFFGTWTIVTLLFPKVIQREKQGLPHLFLFWKSIAITAGFGGLVILGCLFFSNMIVSILFGSEYIVVAGLLWKYAVATTLFACANVFAYYYMSLNKYFPVLISIVVGVLQVIAIYKFHNTLEEVIYIQILLMGILLISMIGYQFFDNIYASPMPKKNLLKKQTSLIKT